MLTYSKGHFLLLLRAHEPDLTRRSHLIYINAVLVTREVKLCHGWFSHYRVGTTACES